MVPSLKLGPALYLQEYNITDSTGKISERIREDIDVKIFTEGTNLWLPAFHNIIHLFNLQSMLLYI